MDMWQTMSEREISLGTDGDASTPTLYDRFRPVTRPRSEAGDAQLGCVLVAIIGLFASGCARRNLGRTLGRGRQIVFLGQCLSCSPGDC